MTHLQPWTDYDAAVGRKPDPQNSRHTVWNCDEFPFVVRWSVPVSDRMTRWVTHGRYFKTIEEAVAAYKRGFSGLSVDLVKYNGGQPGKHLDTLAYRKACRKTRWHESVPADLRN